MAKITVELLRDLEKQVAKGSISYSKMVEILNEQAKYNHENITNYYKVKDKFMSLQGERYFKFNWNRSHAFQVCLQTDNETKRGRGHYIGIYQISRNTFLGNWYSPGHIDECTEKEYNEAFEKAIQILRKNN